jgi:hypothetical protein
MGSEGASWTTGRASWTRLRAGGELGRASDSSGDVQNSQDWLARQEVEKGMYGYQRVPGICSLGWGRRGAASQEVTVKHAPPAARASALEAMPAASTQLEVQLAVGVLDVALPPQEAEQLLRRFPVYTENLDCNAKKASASSAAIHASARSPSDIETRIPRRPSRSLSSVGRELVTLDLLPERDRPEKRVRPLKVVIDEDNVGALGLSGVGELRVRG